MEKYIEEEITFKDLADRLGIKDLNEPQILDMTELGYEILSYDTDNKKETWEPLEAYVVKDNSETHYKLGDLCGTAAHKVYHEGTFVRLDEHPDAVEVSSPIQVVDCQVGNTHNYLAGGQINHNTTTPGGMAIPYMASIRVSITSSGQKQVKDKDGIVRGIHVTAKTVKNKVAPPFRSVQFQIIFGQGVVEHEEVFDAFREHCSKNGSVVFEGTKACPGMKLLSVEGTGAWKTFTVADAGTGEVEVEVKCYKPDFGDKVLNVPEYSDYMDRLFEATFVTTPAMIKDHSTFEGIDSESYTEHAQLQINQAEEDVLAMIEGDD